LERKLFREGGCYYTLFLRKLLEEIAEDRRRSEKLYEDVQMMEKSTCGAVCAAWVFSSRFTPNLRTLLFVKIGGH
jgi:hypothetical protein